MQTHTTAVANMGRIMGQFLSEQTKRRNPQSGIGFYRFIQSNVVMQMTRYGVRSRLTGH